MSHEMAKPVIGFSCGDLNGIGMELILKTLGDHRLLDFCTPVVFASNKSINFYRKSLPDANFNYTSGRDFSRLNPKQVNIYNCWEEEVAITPGQLNEIGGKYGRISLEQAAQALKDGHIHGLVTAPIHKKNVYSEEFPYTGHTPFLKALFGAQDVLMFMVAENIRVGLVTEHLTIAEVAKHITREAILSKLKIMHNSLQKDFGIDKPRIAVLGLNPHAGDEGLIGNEEETIIKPAVKDARHQMLAFGPYSADAFFARGQHERFDGVLAMYHDQGLIPFKSLAIGEGVNYTAGLSAVRTSPDHGTAFDIAGKGKADHTSFLAATFECIEIIRKRMGYSEMRQNPLRKMSARMLANAVDEKIEETE
ncbi:MAG: 4-hydroxythreonine-4-phosphate dehydrogenase PdxA [Chitinophagaceae bacterium]|jgi:4-hydroxythreonine-4-phosphate dehydrogenase|nr:4-hydroxythreonine-4-phosphate dehydrogenase PdxA [Chitinophagaceae bacterium]